MFSSNISCVCLPASFSGHVIVHIHTHIVNMPARYDFCVKRSLVYLRYQRKHDNSSRKLNLPRGTVLMINRIPKYCEGQCWHESGRDLRGSIAQRVLDHALGHMLIDDGSFRHFDKCYVFHWFQIRTLVWQTCTYFINCDHVEPYVTVMLVIANSRHFVKYFEL